MVRIILIANCLADPTGIKFAGYEVDVTEEKAAILVATGQWRYLVPPPPPKAPESFAVNRPQEIPADVFGRPKREYRRKGRG